jgi:hypothetical protein
MERYFECEEDNEVVLMRVEGGGHTWPGSHYNFDRFGGHFGVVAKMSANEVMRRFFAEHPRKGCYTAKRGEQCFKKMAWAKKVGWKTHPEWFRGLTNESSIEAFQEAIHTSVVDNCPRPCDSLTTTTTSPDPIVALADHLLVAAGTISPWAMGGAGVVVILVALIVAAVAFRGRMIHYKARDTFVQDQGRDLHVIMREEIDTAVDKPYGVNKEGSPRSYPCPGRQPNLHSDTLVHPATAYQKTCAWHLPCSASKPGAATVICISRGDSPAIDDLDHERESLSQRPNPRCTIERHGRTTRDVATKEHARRFPRVALPALSDHRNNENERLVCGDEDDDDDDDGDIVVDIDSRHHDLPGTSPSRGSSSTPRPDGIATAHLVGVDDIDDAARVRDIDKYNSEVAVALVCQDASV